MKRFVRAFWIFFASAAGFWGQNCYVTAGNTGNCPTSGAQSPDIKTYLGELVTQFQTMRDQASSVLSPKSRHRHKIFRLLKTGSWRMVRGALGRRIPARLQRRRRTPSAWG